jgi:hypothetical protein
MLWSGDEAERVAELVSALARLASSATVLDFGETAESLPLLRQSAYSFFPSSPEHFDMAARFFAPY